MAHELALELSVPRVHLVEPLPGAPQDAVVVPVGGREALLDVAQERVVEADLVAVERALRLELAAPEPAEQPSQEPAARLAVQLALTGPRSGGGKAPPRARRASQPRVCIPEPRILQSAVADAKPLPELEALRRRLEDEEAAYAQALAALDSKARLALPEETAVLASELLRELNELWTPPSAPKAAGLSAALARRAWDAIGPAVERQARFNAVLVRLLNTQRENAARFHAQLRELAAAVVGYAQRVEPVVDARDDVRVARAPTERPAAARRLRPAARADVRAARRLGGVARPDRGALRGGTCSARGARRGAARAGPGAGDDARCRGFGLHSLREPLPRLARGAAGAPAGLRRAAAGPGPGRGPRLRPRRAARAPAGRGDRGARGGDERERRRGVPREGARGSAGDLVPFLQHEPAGTLGAVFAAQVAEHLEPARLQALIAAAHRALRRDGLLVLETVNAASALAFFDVYIRDLTHVRPLHPETLRFMAAAAGFSEARIELRSPAPEDVKLHLLPSGGLPPPVVKALNENVVRLNALLFAPLDYALIARR